MAAGVLGRLGPVTHVSEAKGEHATLHVTSSGQARTPAPIL